MSDYLIIIFFLLELIFLSYLEHKIWKSFFTPFFFLALPFAFVTAITVFISDNVGFVPFYYPTLLIWNVGLIALFIPSFVTGLLCQDAIRSPFQSKIIEDEDENNHLYITIIAFIIMFLLIFRLFTAIRTSSYMFGSDAFAEELCGRGLWAHIRQAAMAMMAVLIFYYKKKTWYFWLPITVYLLFALVYQVKGWIIISVLSGVMARLFVGKLNLKVSLLMKSVVGAFLLFQIVYTLSFVVAGKSQLGMDVFNYISLHFLHYFTSGVLGLSVDVQRDFPDQQSWEILFTPFVNIAYVLSGQELLSPINPVYYNTGINLTNVRTFFGTIFISTNKIQFLIVSMGIAAYIYSFRIILQKFPRTSFLLMYCFLCSLMAMGWFEYYFHHFDVIETPILYLIYEYIDRKGRVSLMNKTKSVQCS